MQAMYWLIALAALLLIEIVTLGLTTIWFAGGSLVAFFVAIFGGPFWLQFVLFFVVSLLLLLFTRPVAVKYINRSRIRTNYESMPGREGRVTERIDNFNESGTVVVGGNGNRTWDKGTGSGNPRCQANRRGKRGIGYG